MNIALARRHRDLSRLGSAPPGVRGDPRDLRGRENGGTSVRIFGREPVGGGGPCCSCRPSVCAFHSENTPRPPRLAVGARGAWDVPAGGEPSAISVDRDRRPRDQTGVVAAEEQDDSGDFLGPGPLEKSAFGMAFRLAGVSMMLGRTEFARTPVPSGRRRANRSGRRRPPSKRHTRRGRRRDRMRLARRR